MAGGVNEQIPLMAEYQNIDPVAAQSRQYSLQQQGMQTEDMSQQKNDQAAIQQYLREGGDLFSEAGIKQAADTLKGKVTPETYMKLNEYGMSFKQKQMDYANKLAQAPIDKFERQTKLTDLAYTTLQAPLNAYESAWRADLQKNHPEIDLSNVDPKNPMVIAAKQAALPAWDAAKKAQLSMAQQQFGGNIPPEVAPIFANIGNMDPTQANSAFNATELARKINANAAELRLKGAHARLYEAPKLPAGVQSLKYYEFVVGHPDDYTPEEVSDAKAMIKKATALPGAGRNTVAMTPEEEKALNAAVASGKIDYRRVNSRTAPILAKMVVANPNADLEAVSADINLIRNPTYQQKAMNAEILPEVMQNMVTAGKALDLSKAKLAGQAQMFYKDQTNDPAYTEYLTQRNDALMMIAATMRGVGMTDQAHRAEIEASAPTMDAAALDAWMRGQMKSMEPRLRQMHAKQARGGESSLQVAPEVQKSRDVQAKELIQKEYDTTTDPEKKKDYETAYPWLKKQGGATGKLPPEAKSRLKEGVETTFGNNQVWTLRNGQEVRVK